MRAGGGYGDRDASNVFGFYVEKEYVGKRVKSSKVKVTWKFACLPDLRTHEVELKHSLVFGKREIKLDGNIIFHKKQLWNGDFIHNFSVAGHLLCCTIRDDFEGYLYDLKVDGCAFHKLTRISAETLEDMRKSKTEAEAMAAAGAGDVKRLDYNEFVGKDKDTDKDDKKKKKKSKKEKKERKKKDKKQAKKRASSFGSSSDSSDSSDDDDSDDSVEQDLWNAFEKNRKAGAATGSTPGASAPVGAPAAASTGPSWSNDPFAPPGSTSTSVSKLAAGLEGLDFSSPAPAYSQPVMQQTYTSNAYGGGDSGHFSPPVPQGPLQGYSTNPYASSSSSSSSSQMTGNGAASSLTGYGGGGSSSNGASGWGQMPAHQPASSSSFSPPPPQQQQQQQLDTSLYGSGNPYGQEAQSYTPATSYQPQGSYSVSQTLPSQPPQQQQQQHAQYGTGQYASSPPPQQYDYGASTAPPQQQQYQQYAQPPPQQQQQHQYAQHAPPPPQQQQQQGNPFF